MSPAHPATPSRPNAATAGETLLESRQLNFSPRNPLIGEVSIVQGSVESEVVPISPERLQSTTTLIIIDSIGRKTLEPDKLDFSFTVDNF